MTRPTKEQIEEIRQRDVRAAPAANLVGYTPAVADRRTLLAELDALAELNANQTAMIETIDKRYGEQEARLTDERDEARDALAALSAAVSACVRDAGYSDGDAIVKGQLMVDLALANTRGGK